MEEVEQFLIAEPPEEFTCPICTNILSQPIQTACGHHFCESCLDDWLRKCEKAQEEMLCPTCRQNPIPKFLDKAMNRKINQIEIKVHFRLANQKTYLFSNYFLKMFKKNSVKISQEAACGREHTSYLLSTEQNAQMKLSVANLIAVFDSNENTKHSMKLN